MSIPFLLDQNPNVASVGLDGERSDPRERFLMALLRRTQRERRRRLALTGGIRLVRRAEPGYCEHVRALDR